MVSQADPAWRNSAANSRRPLLTMPLGITRATLNCFSLIVYRVLDKIVQGLGSSPENAER